MLRRAPALVCACLLAAQDAGAQDRPRLEGASARVQVAAGAGAEVVILYAVVAAASAELVLRAVPFFGLAPERIEVLVDGARARLEPARAAGATFEAGVIAGAPLPGDRMIPVEVRYHVSRAVVRDGDRLDVRVPLVILDAAPTTSHERFFDATLVAPAGFTVTESFPTVRITRDSTAAAVRFSSALQVVPSLLRWRGTQGAAPRLSFAARVDLGLLLLIVLFAWLGVRALMRSPAGAQ